jgi:biotin synthase
MTDLPLDRASLDLRTLAAWLREAEAGPLGRLFAEADRVRRANVGDEVHLRGLCEISSHCARHCTYCGLRAPNRALERYRMTIDEIRESALVALRLGYGTVVLQSGEDDGLDVPALAALVRELRSTTPLAVTLSLGERTEEELAMLRDAGADRYLLRFETSNPALFARIHPPRHGASCDRVGLLRSLRRMGYAIGSGVMVGIPGQTHDDLARDLDLFRELDLDMIGVGPFLPHPGTPLGARPPEPAPDQAPASAAMTYTMVALARLVCPRANIPATTALATTSRVDGRELALSRGANVVMPNVTPTRYRALYEIYPDKACIAESADQCAGCLARRIHRIGRVVGRGRGDAPATVVA